MPSFEIQGYFVGFVSYQALLLRHSRNNRFVYGLSFSFHNRRMLSENKPPQVKGNSRWVKKECIVVKNPVAQGGIVFDYNLYFPVRRLKPPIRRCSAAEKEHNKCQGRQKKKTVHKSTICPKNPNIKESQEMFLNLQLIHAKPHLYSMACFARQKPKRISLLLWPEKIRLCYQKSLF